MVIRYGRFCSAFPDTDTCFGSHGSFFDFWPEQGSFESNPPFIPAVIARMAAHIDAILLTGSSGDGTEGGGGRPSTQKPRPLSFVVVVPAWGGETAADGGANGAMKNSPAIECLSNSPYLRRKLLASNRKHEYLEGHQHATKPGKR